MSDQKLTTNEAGRRLGLSDDSVRRMCEQGQLDAYRRPGGHWRIDRGELDRFVESARPRVRR